MPVYECQEITDNRHESCRFRTDYQFNNQRENERDSEKSKRMNCQRHPKKRENHVVCHI